MYLTVLFVPISLSASILHSHLWWAIHDHSLIVCRTLVMLADRNYQKIWRSISELLLWWCLTDRSSSGWNWLLWVSRTTLSLPGNSSPCTNCVRSSLQNRYYHDGWFYLVFNWRWKLLIIYSPIIEIWYQSVEYTSFCFKCWTDIMLTAANVVGALWLRSEEYSLSTAYAGLCKKIKPRRDRVYCRDESSQRYEPFQTCRSSKSQCIGFINCTSRF